MVVVVYEEGERGDLKMTALVSMRLETCHTHNTDSLSFRFLFLKRKLSRNHLFFLCKRVTRRPQTVQTTCQPFPLFGDLHRGNSINNHSSCDRI